MNRESMDEYIKKSDIKKAFLKGFTDGKKYPDFVNWLAKEAERIVSNMPSTDVKPVKRGHWYYNKSKYISELGAYFIQACCPCCGRYSDSIDIYTTTMSNEFCSHCGARMDLKDGDAE